jgi:hypothetical protein
MADEGFINENKDVFTEGPFSLLTLAVKDNSQGCRAERGNVKPNWGRQML